MLPAPQSQWGTGAVPHPRNPFPRPSVSVSGYTTWPATRTPGPSAAGCPPPSLLAQWGEGVAWAETVLLASGVPAISLLPPDPPDAAACVPRVHLPGSPSPRKAAGAQGPVWSLEQSHTRGLHPVSSRFPAACRRGGAGCRLPGVCGLPPPALFIYVGKGLPAGGTNSPGA